MTDNFRDNEERNRFELDVGGNIAFVAYRKSPDAITLVHTEVPPKLGGQGIGSKLARATLDAVRAQGRHAHGRMRIHPEFHEQASSDTTTCWQVRSTTRCLAPTPVPTDARGGTIGIWRIASGIRSFGSFHGNMLTSRLRRQHRGFHRDRVGMRRDIVGQDQHRRLAIGARNRASP